MTRLKFVALAVLGALASTPALAADLYVPPAAGPAIYDPAPAGNWDGLYIGAFAGFHAGTVIEYECSGLCSGDFALNGIAGGVQAGYDTHIDDRLVLGGFVQVPLLKPTGSATLGVGGPTFNVDPQWAVLAGVRLGYDLGAYLPYAFVGGAIENDTVSTTFGASSNVTHTGLIAGFGAEYALDQNWSIDGRYTFMGLGSGTYDFGGGTDRYGENSHNFTIGVNYRF